MQSLMSPAPSGSICSWKGPHPLSEVPGGLECGRMTLLCLALGEGPQMGLLGPQCLTGFRAAAFQRVRASPNDKNTRKHPSSWISRPHWPFLGPEGPIHLPGRVTGTAVPVKTLASRDPTRSHPLAAGGRTAITCSGCAASFFLIEVKFTSNEPF